MRDKVWVLPTVVFTAVMGYGIFALTKDNVTTGAICLGIAIIGLLLTYIWFMFLENIWRNKQVLKHGEPGTARVLQMFDTTITINDDPLVKLELEVTPQRGATYLATAKVTVPRLNPLIYQPGTLVAVKIDPQNPMRVAIDPQASALLA